MNMDLNDKKRLDQLFQNLINTSSNALVALRKENIDQFYEKFQELTGAMNELVLLSGGNGEL